MCIKEKLINNLHDKNVLSQKGLIEMFDATIGRSTILMPFGGKMQRSESQVSVQKIPVGNHFTNTASMMAYGYNPDLSSWSPFHGAQYAVVEAITKIVAAGGRYNNIRFSFQEYFEKMTQNPTDWGKPTAALLGALQMQADFKLASIGGKDSMSGTFQNTNVPPMLMAFGITKVDADNVISSDLKTVGNNLYLIQHTPHADYLPDVEQLKNNYDFISQEIENKHMISAFAIGFGGVAEAICKMAFGNKTGAEISIENASQLFNLSYGSVLVETPNELDFGTAIYLGKTIFEKVIKINSESVDIEELYNANTSKFSEIYPITVENQ
jgi:phosphoribosylformylglycinamidine synthase